MDIWDLGPIMEDIGSLDLMEMKSPAQVRTALMERQAAGLEKTLSSHAELTSRTRKYREASVSSIGSALDLK